MKSTFPKVPNPTDKHVGTRIRTRRMMLGMSQTNLADAVALTFQQIQKYEKGTNRVGASRLQQFAKILSVPISFFFEGAPTAQLTGIKTTKGDDEVTPAHISDFLASRDGLRLVKAFSQIADRSLRRNFVGLAEEIAEKNGSRRRR
jgi:transcriptional regulator with XRE-family HTH domain